MAHYKLQTPLSEADVRQLQLEDTVTIDGTIFGMRDATQIRIFDEGIAPPADLTGSVCLHTAPGVRKRADGRYEKLSIGTTTALAVHIEWAHTHISHNPVAVNIQCWRGERASATIAADGKVSYGNGAL